ncbi:hypothetical protein MBRA_00296 [Methylobacterium brachiatum]|nr:hypothetical protein MBRA_00296 [Methylobacterium brachiatum]
MRLIAVAFIGLVTVGTVPARASGGDAAERMLDAMTRHDLCAHDDAQLRKLNRSLAATPIRHPAAGTRAR